MRWRSSAGLLLLRTGVLQEDGGGMAWLVETFLHFAVWYFIHEYDFRGSIS
jgi:hypothetical protein